MELPIYKNGMRRALAALLLPLFFAAGASALDVAGLRLAASAKWDLKAAQELPPQLTEGRLADLAKQDGPEKADALRAKRDAVSALLGRYRSGKVLGADLDTADAHLRDDLRDEVYALFLRENAGAAEPAPVRQLAPTAPRLEELSRLLGRELAAEELAAFYDGLTPGRAGPALQAVAADETAAGTMRASPPAVTARPASRASVVPPLAGAQEPAGPGAYVRPPMPDISETGRIHKALKHWDERRRKGVADYKGARGPEKAAAAAAAAGSAVMQGLIFFSGLTSVEYAGARLRWDIKHGAPAGVIAADSAKLAFHCAVSFVTFLPVPIGPTIGAAVAGNPAAVAYVAVMVIGPANRFIFHWVD